MKFKILALFLPWSSHDLPWLKGVFRFVLFILEVISSALNWKIRADLIHSLVNIQIIYTGQTKDKNPV